MEHVDSWRALPAAQQPEWPDAAALDAVRAELRDTVPLVVAAECEQLKQRLGAVARGEAFLLQGGDCAETFADVREDSVRRKVRTLLQMALVLQYAASVPVVKIGRMAGQYAKPRSKPTETRGGLTLPAYRGDAVNGFPFEEAERTPDPNRLLRMHQAASGTLNLVRAFTTGGYADLRQAHAWNQDFVARSPVGERYAALATQIDQALNFMRACGADERIQHAVEFFVSHEGLLLEYEEPLVREDPATGRRYATSGHMLWIGERTRDLDGAHVEFFSKLSNPVAVKLGPTTDSDTVLRLIDRLDPEREPGLPASSSAWALPGPRSAARAGGEGGRGGGAGGVGERSHARQHLRGPVGPQDAPLRRHRRRGEGLLRGPPRARDASRGRAPGVHRGRRHRMRGRR